MSQTSLRSVSIERGAALCAALLLLLFGGGGTAAARPTLTTFEVEGTSTFVTGINGGNSVVGFLFGSPDSFVRTADGTVTTFNVGGASTIAVGIDDAGTITGGYFDGAGDHGFLRTADGTITSFNVLGDIYTDPRAINNKGVVAGCYDLCQHGFLRTAGGKIKTFDIPDLDLVSGINDGRAIVGTTGSYASGFHGFLRASDGTISAIDVPGAQHTFATAINSAGFVTGRYQDPDGAVHGFVRGSDGSITPFDALDCVASPVDINDSGSIAGPCATGRPKAQHNSVGFLRDAGGSITEFHAPGGTRTNPVGINNLGVIAGDYRDRQTHVYRGFLRIP
jgi:hypothetical protein